MIAYKDLVDTLRRLLWPAGEARTLRDAHDRFYLSAMIQMQRDFDILQQNNASVFKHASTYFECGKSVVSCPWGQVRRVYTIANNDWCDKVYYRQGTYDQVQQWARSLDVTPPENTDLPELPQGFKYPESSTDLSIGSRRIGRARVGMYCIHNKRLYVTPWIQSNESIVVEWDGIKTEWKPDDAVDPTYWHSQSQELINLHVEMNHEARHGDKTRVELIASQVSLLRADLLHDERNNTWVRNTNPVLEGSSLPTSDQTEAEAVPEEDESVTFSMTADSGSNDASQNSVAALLENDVREFLILAGDISYGDSYEDVVTAKYPSQALILPSRGNHDYDINSGADYEDFFAAISNSGVRYEYVNGPAHFFFIPSDPRETLLGYVDATTSVEDGPTGQWLKAKVALSPATWKFLVFHHSSKTSGSSHGSSLWMDFDFAAMGLAGKIDGIFMGHAHNMEAVVVNGIRYLTCGAGGKTLNGFGAAITGSEFRSQTLGALFNSVSETEWIYEFKDVSGNVLHTETITK